MANKTVEVKETIYLRRKKVTSETRGDDPDTHIRKLGSIFKGQKPLSGLSVEEEKKYLAGILGISPTSQEWDKAVRSYWANVSCEVPPGDGLKLQVGMAYNSEEDADNEENGTPLVLEDYILYRFALVHSRVANKAEDAYKSPKIEFYLYSEEKALNDSHSLLKKKQEAYAEYLKIATDESVISAILRLTKDSSDPDGKRYFQPSFMSRKQKDIAIEKVVVENPTHFLTLVKDKSLSTKAFIEECISEGKLTRLPNTDTIMYGDNTTLGYNLGEAVAFLNDKKNIQILNTLTAQLKHLTKTVNTSSEEEETAGNATGSTATKTVKKT